VIAETGAGQHGVAAATACAMLGLECRVFMGATDVLRQRPNVQRMRLLGAEVVPVEAGRRTLKDAINAAMREWVATSRDTHYLVGSVVGPDPFPRMVRDFQAVIGRETLTQCLDRFGEAPDAAIACVGGGSNAIGLFHALLGTAADLIGVEAAGEGLASGRHAASLTRGSEGVLHGARTLLLQDDDGQIVEAHSVSAGLDYPGVGPEHAFLRDSGRVRYVAITDREALDAFRVLSRLEGILPALESAHAVAVALSEAARRPKEARVVVNLSGRGDKDLDHVLGISETPA
jgi:tryptophan synthase beta chain